MMLRFFLLMLTVCLFPSMAMAQRSDEMLAACRAVSQAPIKDRNIRIPPNFAAYECWGAVRIIQELVNTYTDTKSPYYVDFCVAEEVTRSQLAAIFVSYLDANPQRRSDRFLDVMLDALRRSYPCKK